MLEGLLVLSGAVIVGYVVFGALALFFNLKWPDIWKDIRDPVTNYFHVFLAFLRGLIWFPVFWGCVGASVGALLGWIVGRIGDLRSVSITIGAVIGGAPGLVCGIVMGIAQIVVAIPCLSGNHVWTERTVHEHASMAGGRGPYTEVRCINCGRRP
jgi:hypothetical protein